MPRFQLKAKDSKKVLFSAEAGTLAEVVVQAVQARVNLSGADLSRAALRGATLSGADLSRVDLSRADLSGAFLSGANLRGADLSWANLRNVHLRGATLCWTNLSGANLSGADLSRANLRVADLSGADLRSVHLRGANLSLADLSGADLRGVFLRCTDLSGADLNNARMTWKSRDLLAALLFRAAGLDLERRKIAGLVLISKDWCWDQFLTFREIPGFDWAIETLAAYVIEGDGAPEILVQRARQWAQEVASQKDSGVQNL